MDYLAQRDRTRRSSRATRAGIETARQICRDVQVQNGVGEEAEFTVHHVLGLVPSFLDLVDAMEPLEPYIERYFAGKFILNSIGGTINLKGRSSYTHRIHRDIRSFSGDVPLMINTLIMLDDFAPDNGATLLATGSHRFDAKPNDEEFAGMAEQAVAPAGSVLIFNSNLWHAAGNNRSDRPRRAITPTFSRPFIKPQFDYPRALGYDRGAEFSAFARQVIGYNARIPATLGEWYQPVDRRMYRARSGVAPPVCAWPSCSPISFRIWGTFSCSAPPIVSSSTTTSRLSRTAGSTETASPARTDHSI